MNCSISELSWGMSLTPYKLSDIADMRKGHSGNMAGNPNFDSGQTEKSRYESGPWRKVTEPYQPMKSEGGQCLRGTRPSFVFPLPNAEAVDPTKSPSKHCIGAIFRLENCLGRRLCCASLRVGSPSHTDTFGSRSTTV